MLSDYLIVSDVDGTLLNHDGTICPRTLEAVHRFIAEGGKFSLDTGRVHFHCGELLETLGINIPSIHCNGGYLYDNAEDHVLDPTYLPRKARAQLLAVVKEFPDVCLAVFTEDEFCRLNDPQGENDSCRRLRCELRRTEAEEIPGEWHKALFFRDEDKMAELHTYLNAHPISGCYHVNSNAELCEVMAEGVSKGNGLRKLARHLSIPIERTFAIGDYFNDVSMLQAAGVSVAVGDGAPEVAAMCDMVVGACADGAVADLIEYIERLEGLR
ncbi:MAG: HAD family hydrolase [Oscillospiraceae bacterium]|nr:HAD family hydrolase [Oscillospiraceae bacterium]